MGADDATRHPRTHAHARAAAHRPGFVVSHTVHSPPLLMRGPASGAMNCRCDDGPAGTLVTSHDDANLERSRSTGVPRMVWVKNGEKADVEVSSEHDPTCLMELLVSLFSLQGGTGARSDRLVSVSSVFCYDGVFGGGRRCSAHMGRTSRRTSIKSNPAVATQHAEGRRAGSEAEAKRRNRPSSLARSKGPPWSPATL